MDRSRNSYGNDPSAPPGYFGTGAGSSPGGWYSYDVGTWHMIALNSECNYGSGTVEGRAV